MGEFPVGKLLDKLTFMPTNRDAANVLVGVVGLACAAHVSSPAAPWHTLVTAVQALGTAGVPIVIGALILAVCAGHMVVEIVVRGWGLAAACHQAHRARDQARVAAADAERAAAAERQLTAARAADAREALTARQLVLLEHLPDTHHRVLSALLEAPGHRLSCAELPYALVGDLLQHALLASPVAVGGGRVLYELRDDAAPAVEQFVAEWRAREALLRLARMREALETAGEGGRQLIQLFGQDPPADASEPHHEIVQAEAFHAIYELTPAGVLAERSPKKRGGRTSLELCPAAVPLAEEILGRPVRRTSLLLSPDRLRTNARGGGGVTNDGPWGSPMPPAPHRLGAV